MCTDKNIKMKGKVRSFRLFVISGKVRLKESPASARNKRKAVAKYKEIFNFGFYSLSKF